MKTLAIRLEDEQHAQLGMIAQLEGLNVTDAIRQAIDQWTLSRRSNPELQERAHAVLEDIEREAATRRGAIAALLGDTSTTADRAASPESISRRGSHSKGGDNTNA